MNDLQKRTKRVRRCMAAALLCICMAMTLVPVELYGVSIPAPNDTTPREILSFSNLPIEISEQFAEIGTPQKDLYLPETLEAVCRDLPPQPEQQPDADTEVPSTEPSSEETPETDTQDAPAADTPDEEPANIDTDTPREEPASPDTDTPHEEPANPDTDTSGEEPANPGINPPGDEPSQPDADTSGDTPEPPVDTPANENQESEPPVIDEESVAATAAVAMKTYYAEPDAPAQFQPLANEGQTDGGQTADTSETAETISVPVMFWSSSPAYDSELEGTYQFTPVLPDCYTLAEGILPPVISVTIEGGGICALSDTEEIEDETPASPACGTVSTSITWDFEDATLPDGELIILPDVTLTITGKLTIGGNVTISGGGQILRGSANAQLLVRTGNALTVQGVTIDGDNKSSGLSMIEARKSTVTLDGCKIQNCTKTVTPNDSGDMWLEKQGGAALLIDRGGTAVLNNAEITGCSSTVKGGAVFAAGSAVTIQGGTYSGNSTTFTSEPPMAGTGGGFLFNDASVVTIEGGSFLNNASTGEGGCIYHGGSKKTNTHLHGGFFSGNTSSYPGKEGSGAIWNSSVDSEATILTLSGSVQFAGDGGASGMDGVYLGKSESTQRKVYIRDTLSFPVRIYVEAEENYVIAEGAENADGSPYTLLEERDMKKIKFIDAGGSGKNWYAELDKENNQVRIVSTDPGYGFFVDYDSNGATGSVKDEKEYRSTGNPDDLTATILGADGLSKGDDVFYEWNTRSDGKGDGYDKGDQITLTDDLKLYAIFRAKYAATFYSGDGEDAPEVITADPDGRIETPRLKTLKKTEGYTSVGWSRSKEPDDPATAEGTKPGSWRTLTDNTSYYGVYKKSVRVSFLPGADDITLTPARKDGTNYCIAHEEGTTYRHHEFELNPNITREGYTCFGWTDENGSFYKYGSTQTFETDATLTACWLANDETEYYIEHYTQNVEDDGYTQEKTLLSKAKTDSAVTITADPYYGFDLNETKSVISGTVTADSSLTLRLYYDRVTANIAFNLNEAPGDPPATQQVRYGAALQPVADPSWTGWSFGGWYKNEDATVDSLWKFDKTAAENGVLSGDVPLYANWFDNIDPEFADLEDIVYAEVYTKLLDWIIGKKSLQISIPVTEEGSGIDEERTTYILEPDNATEAQKRAAVSIPADVDPDTNTIRISITEDFKGKIKVTCYDKVGNHSTISLTADDGGIIAEDSAPEISFSDASGKKIISSDPYYDSARIYVTVEDEVEYEVKDEAGKKAVSGGITKISYWVDDGEKQTPPETSEEDLKNNIITSCLFDVTIDANVYGYGKHALHVEATDRVGNTSENFCFVELLRRNRRYLVKHFTMNTDCQTYTEEESERQEFEGYIGETVTADPKSYTGFFDNTSHPDRIPSGEVVDSEADPLELKFYYDRNIYNISYDLNGASGTAPSSRTARYGVPAPESEPDPPDRAGYTFKGWYLDAAGTANGQWDFSLPPEANTTEASVTLYAKWADEIAPVLGEATYNKGYRRLLDYIIRKPDLLITVPITEEGSGVAEANYILMPDNGSLQEGKAAIGTKNGQTVAQFYIKEDFSGSAVLSASDKAGNMSAEKLLTLENGGIIVEDSAPEIAFSSKDGKLSDVFDKDVTIDVSVKDISSRRKVSGGIASVTYQIDGKKPGSPKEDFTKEITKSVDFSVRIKNEGTHRLSVTATDNVGNETTRQVKIKIQENAKTPATKKKKTSARTEPQADLEPQTVLEPRTGDYTNVWLYAVIAMLAGLLYLFLLFSPDMAPKAKDDMQKKIKRLARWAGAGRPWRKPVAMTAVFFLIAYINIAKKFANKKRKNAYEP